MNNCAGGTTPWGTILSGEENFNQYFLAAGATPQEARYGLAPEDAYLLCSLVMDLKISEIVDAGQYVVSALLPEAVFLPA